MGILVEKCRYPQSFPQRVGNLLPYLWKNMNFVENAMVDTMYKNQHLKLCIMTINS